MTDGESVGASTDRAFVLGLDGIPWDLLDEWTADGTLPNFAKLRAEGAAGPLESTTPATTPLAWPSIATGTWPDKHGIYWFQRLASDYTHSMNTSDHVKRPSLWDLVEPAVVGNVPMTYPASEIDGEMVTGMMTPTLDAAATHPDSLATRIDEEVPDYRIGLDWSEYADRTDEFPAEIRSLVDARRDVMRMLMDVDDWRLFFFVYTAPDRLQHLIWDRDVLREHYELLDEILGEVMSYVERRDATLFVASDHGFGPIDRAVSVPTLLEREGFLARRTNSGARAGLGKLGIEKSTVTSWLNAVGLDENTVADLLPETIVNKAATQIPGDHALFDVDYANTTAFVHGGGNVYVNDTERFDEGQVPPARVPDVKESIEAAVTELTDPETGERVLDVADGDELFPTDPDSPDLVVKPRDGYMKLPTFTETVFTDPGAAANHRSEGVLFAWGPDVEAGSTPSRSSVVDVAPTILHAVGETVPDGMDGRVLDELFEPGSEPAERPVRRGEYDGRAVVAGSATGERDADDEEFDDVEDRLRGLGYME